MRAVILRFLMVAFAGLWLAGCATSNFASNDTNKPAAAGDGTQAMAMAPANSQMATAKGLLGSDPHDDLSLGKKYYRAGDFGLAEQHFQQAVETHPRDAEAWLGLAASYDQLRRFDLADRAYAQATRIAGLTVEIINNEGYSYMLRGDYRRAAARLAQAAKQAPDNAYVKNNIRLLAEASHEKKSIE